jgi:hypothetical protein
MWLAIKKGLIVTEKTKRPIKAKRKLSNIDFSSEGSHIALVSKKQGGTASGADYKLVLKASNFSEEFVQKMQQVRVTMELPDFLRRFFSLYGDDAEVLALMMGYEPMHKMPDGEMMYNADHEDYIQSRLESYEVMKSAYSAESLSQLLSELDENEYLALLNDQALIEKAFDKLEKAYKPKVGDMVSWNSSGGRATGKIEKIVQDGTIKVPNTSFSVKGTEDNPATLIRLYRDDKPTDVRVGHKSSTLTKVQKSLDTESKPTAFAEDNDTSTNASVETSQGVSTSVNKEELEKSKMDDELKVETVEKAQFELVQKALEEQKVQLQKALDTIAEFEADKKEAINKAKTEKIKAIVKDESNVQAIAKAGLTLESEDDFTAFVLAIEAIMQVVESSDMFVEKGASTEEASSKESAVARLLKAKQAKQAK